MKFLKLKFLAFTLLILFTFYDDSNAANSSLDSPCQENWLPYKDEKCFTVVDDSFRTFDEAEKSCAKLDSGSTLALIHSKEEQTFLTDYLFKTAKKVENFWIGARFANGTFEWLDKTEFGFTNWEPKGARNKTDYCVQMQAEESILGKWIDEPCSKKNLVVCQRMQTWSLTRMQKTLLDSRKKLQDSIEQLHQNPVPIGFIYIQLPNQPEPKSIWPMIEWKEVTSEYAGLFFRVEGGDSKSFDSSEIQEDNSPRLAQVDFRKKKDAQDSVTLKAGDWTPHVKTTANDDGDGLAFLLSGGEVRPRNKAVKIWKRV